MVINSHKPNGSPRATLTRVEPVTIQIVDGPTCPRCNSPEVLLGGTVRPFKVHDGVAWRSNCTACSIWF
jgi:hypothetical protein